MMPVDLWAACAAFVAGSAVAIRARMLRPHQQAWTHAPPPVYVGLSILALGLLMSAASIWFGAHATPREALVYTILAVVGLIMLWNLNRTGRLAEARRREFAEEARMAMVAGGAPARYQHERRR